MLGADIFIFESCGLGLGSIGQTLEPGREAGLRTAVRSRGLLQEFTGGPRQLAGIDRHFSQHFRTMPSCCSASVTSRCSGSISGWPDCSASCCEPITDSWAFSVYFSGRLASRCQLRPPGRRRSPKTPVRKITHRARNCSRRGGARSGAAGDGLTDRTDGAAFLDFAEVVRESHRVSRLGGSGVGTRHDRR